MQIKQYKNVEEMLNEINSIEETRWEAFTWWVGDKFSNFIQFFRNIDYGIQNLWLWLPIIWSDRNWDQYYIYEILEFKIRNTRDLIDKYSRFVNSDKVVADMDIICSLFKYVAEEEWLLDDYFKDDHEFYERNWAEYESRNRLFMEICDNINHWWD